MLKQFGKPLRVQLRVTNRRRDRPMPQITLDDPDIGPFVDQSVPATVPEHMRMNL